MKFLIYGGKGWIGSQVVNLLKDRCDEVVVSDVRTDNEEEVEKEIKEVKPDRVMTFVGRTHGIRDGKLFGTIDYLESKDKLYENIRDNLFSHISLAFICKRHNVHLTIMATGCIFKYDDNHPIGGKGFEEEENANFFESSYSVMKGFNERLLKNFDNVAILRLRMPISGDYNPRNFITKIINYEKVIDIKNSMSVLSTLLPLLVDISITEKKGIVNFTNPGSISHSEILEMYKELVDPSFTYKTFTLEEQNKILLSGRSNNFLETTKLEGWYPSIPDIHTAVRTALLSMKKTRYG